MGSNLAYGATNLVDGEGASVACVDADADWPASNLQLVDIGLPMRTVNDDATSLVLDLGAVTEVADFALVLHKVNFTADAIVELTFTDGAAGGGSMVANPAAFLVDQYGWFAAPVDDQHRNSAAYFHRGTLNFRSVVIDIDDDPNPDGYLQVARLMLIELSQPEHGYFDFNGGWVDPSDRSETPGSNMVHRVRTKYRRMSGECPALTEAEYRSMLLELDAVAGKTKDVLWVPSPPWDYADLADGLQFRMIWGPQDDVGQFRTPPSFAQYQRSIGFRERT